MRYFDTGYISDRLTISEDNYLGLFERIFGIVIMSECPGPKKTFIQSQKMVEKFSNLDGV